MSPGEALHTLCSAGDRSVVWAATRLFAADAQTQRAGALGLARRIARDRQAGVFWSPVHDVIWSWWTTSLPAGPAFAEGGAASTTPPPEPREDLDIRVARALAVAAGRLDAEGLAPWVQAQVSSAAVIPLLAFEADPVHDVALYGVRVVDAALVAAVAARRPTRLALLAWRAPKRGEAWSALERLAATPPSDATQAAEIAGILVARLGRPDASASRVRPHAGP